MGTEAMHAERTRSVWSRAVLAIAFLVGFYVLALVVAGLLIAVPVLMVVFLRQMNLGALVLAFGGFSLLRSLVPKRVPFDPPGPALSAAEQPELAAVVQRAARDAGQPVPPEQYLIDDVNAFVTEVGGFLGFGGRRVLAVGVPLMEALSPQELESVLAHEFGHFAGGDTRLGGIVHRTRSALGRTLEQMEGSALQAVFIWYANFYLRVSQSVSRAQEFAADRTAAEATTPQVAAMALARLPTASAAYHAYLHTEYVPVLEAGYRPPFLDGYRAHLHATHGEASAADVADAVLGSSSSSSFDSHPPLVERIQALGQDPAVLLRRPPPEPVAATLLRNRASVDDALVGHQLREGPRLAPIPWGAVPDRVLAPMWQRAVAEEVAPVVPSLSAATMPLSPEELADLGTTLMAHGGAAAARPQRVLEARRLGSAFLCAAAIEHGWAPEAPPGAPVRFGRNGEVVDVLGEWGRVIDGEATPATWAALVARCGFTADAAEIAQSHGTLVGPQSARLAPVSPSTSAADRSAPHRRVTYSSIPPGQRGRGKNRPLVIEGDLVSLGEHDVRADEVLAGTFTLGGDSDIKAKVVMRTGDGTWTFKAAVTAKRNQEQVVEAFGALLDWFVVLVQPRLVDRYLDRMRTDGTIDVAGVTLSPEGLHTRRGIVAFDEIVEVDFDGSKVTVHRAADHVTGRRRVASVSAAKEDAVLLPNLLRAAAMEFPH